MQTICFGVAMSMGSLLLTGGAPGKRMALPNSRILIHQPTGGYQGQATDIEIHARETLALRQLDEIYARHTGRTVEQIHDDMDRDRFFTAEEAVDYGLVDRVIESHELTRSPPASAPAPKRLEALDELHGGGRGGQWPPSISSGTSPSRSSTTRRSQAGGEHPVVATEQEPAPGRRAIVRAARVRPRWPRLERRPWRIASSASSRGTS